MFKNRSAIGAFRIARFTKDAYLKLYKGARHSSWYDIFRPDNISDFVCESLLNIEDRFSLDDHIACKVATIDEEYLSWLQTHGLKHKDKVLGRYVDSLSDTDLDRLAAKNSLNVDLQLYGIPLIISNNGGYFFNKDLDLELDDDNKKSLSAYLATQYTDCEVFVPGYLVRDDVFFKDSDLLINLAKAHFEDGIDATLAKFKEQKLYSDKENCMFVMIPYAVRKVYDQVSFNSCQILDPSRITSLNNPLANFDNNSLWQNGFVRNFEGYLGNKGMSDQKTLTGSFGITAEVIPLMRDNIRKRYRVLEVNVDS